MKEIEQILHELNESEKKFYEEKRVLVTGGAGFLGSWLCETLIRLGSEVTCLDNLSSGRFENIRHLVNEENFEYIRGDVSERIEGRYDIIFHLASRASPLEFSRYPIEIIKANAFGTYNLLELARRNDSIFFLASTSEVYGDPKVIPIPEDYRGNVNPVGERSCYDESKRLAEALCYAFYKQYGLRVMIGRIFNTYGPRMRYEGYYERVIPRFIVQALRNEPITIFGDGNQTRSFCYVTDLIIQILKFVSKNLKFEVLNLGNDEEIKIIDLAKLIIKLANSSSRIVFLSPMPDDPKRRKPDLSKMFKLLNFKPKIPLKEGLLRTISWFKMIFKNHK